MPLKPLVYLIDDDKRNYFTVQNIFADTYPECFVVCFNSAEEALQVLKKVKHDPANFPTLILLELYMPKKDRLGFKDGWDFLEEYTSFQNNSFNTCDVVILTCFMYPKDIERAKRYRCVTDFIIKPFTEESVTFKLDKIFYKKKCNRII